MNFKNYVSVFTAFVAGAIVLTTSCKKNDDLSNSLNNGDNQIAASISAVPGNQVSGASQNQTEDIGSYTITTHDGHTIGVNGQQPTTSSYNPKGGTNTSMGCGAASNLTVTAYASSTGNALSCNWTSGSGSYLGVFINGKLYVDPASGYGLYNTMVSGIWAYCQGISGGIQPNEQFNVFVRTYCNNDTTGSILGVNCFDSPITSITTPSTFLGTCGTTTGGTTKGHKKGGR